MPHKTFSDYLTFLALFACCLLIECGITAIPVLAALAAFELCFCFRFLAFVFFGTKRNGDRKTDRRLLI